MVTQVQHRTDSRASRLGVPRRRIAVARKIVGGFFVSMGGVHLGIVAADPQIYGPFADAAHFPFITDAWRDVFMANPTAWGLAMTAGETALGVLLLRGGRWARLGWAGVIGFHMALMLFGWQAWLWCVPALALLVPLAAADWRQLGTEE